MLTTTPVAHASITGELSDDAAASKTHQKTYDCEGSDYFSTHAFSLQ